MKDWQDRIRDTIAFIDSAAVNSSSDKRVPIAAVLHRQNWQGQIPQAVSDAMSQGPNKAIRHRDAATTQRKYRRAILLIQVQLLNQPVAAATNAVGSIPDGGLKTSLGTALGTAYTRLAQPLQNALQGLVANPGNWLAHNKIQMVRTVNVNGPAPYRFYYAEADNRYVFTTPAEAADKVTIPLTVYHVDVQPYTSVSGHLGAVAGVAIAGAHQFMVTTQLSGCSIMYQLDAARANMVAAHIQPGGPAGSAGRHYSLVTTLRGGALAAAPHGGASGVFGASKGGTTDDYDPEELPARHTFCIGVKTPNGWELHCQRHNTGRPAEAPLHWRIQ